MAYNFAESTTKLVYQVILRLDNRQFLITIKII
jgi:hypothetical protein